MLIEQSPVSEVHFAGFRAPLHGLQRAGWEMVMNERVSSDFRYDGRLELLMRHPTHRIAVTAVCRNFEQAMHMSRRHSHLLYGGELRNPGPVIFEVTHMATNIVRVPYSVQPSEGPVAFARIDAMPSRSFVSEESIWDMPVFKPMGAPVGEELIVDPLTVSQMLELIHKMQAPEQQAIRERARNREVVPTAIATILAFPNAA